MKAKNSNYRALLPPQLGPWFKENDSLMKKVDYSSDFYWNTIYNELFPELPHPHFLARLELPSSNTSVSLFLNPFQLQAGVTKAPACVLPTSPLCLAE